jgi:hypothetical protein
VQISVISAIGGKVWVCVQSGQHSPFSVQTRNWALATAKSFAKFTAAFELFASSNLLALNVSPSQT